MSASIKIGLEPLYKIAFIGATNVTVGAITSVFSFAPINFNALNALKVKIYPNPSTTGNIKMEWANEYQIDQIIILSQGEDSKLNFYVKKQNELTVDGLENGKYFVRFYSQNKLKGIRQIKVMKF